MADEASEGWFRYLREPGTWAAPRPLAPLETPRTMVRCYRRGDGPVLFDAVNRRRGDLLPWMLWATTDHRSVDDSIHYVERHRRSQQLPGCTNFPMGVFDRMSGRQIGGTGLHDIRPGLRQAEVGYWVASEHQGKGVATEAIGGLMGAALTAREKGGWGLRRLVLYVAVGNHPSRRVCEKLGLRLEGRMRAERYNGLPDEAPMGYLDTLLYAVLDDEWDHARNRALPDIGWDPPLPTPSE